MSSKNRAQQVTLTVSSNRIAFLPVGKYSLHIDDTRIERGSVTLKARIVDSMKEEVKDESPT